MQSRSRFARSSWILLFAGELFQVLTLLSPALHRSPPPWITVISAFVTCMAPPLMFTSLLQLNFCSIACGGRAQVNVGCAPFPGTCPNSAGLPLKQEGQKTKIQHGYLHPLDGDSVALAKGEAVQVSSRMGLDSDFCYLRHRQHW